MDISTWTELDRICITSNMFVVPLWVVVLCLWSMNSVKPHLVGQSKNQHYSPASPQACDPGPDGRMCYFLLPEAKNQTEAEESCASRGTGSHLVAMTDRAVLAHVTYMLTSRHVTEAWIGAQYSVSESQQGMRTANSVDCGYLEVSSSKSASWRRTSCSEHRAFHCLYTRNRGSLRSCRYDFTQCGKYCVRQVNTMFHPHKSNWYHAAQYCLSLNTELPAIRSHAEARQWAEQSNLCNITAARAPSLNTWTNYTNLQWEWTTGEPVRYTKWLPNSPQPEVGPCVKMEMGTHLIQIGFRSEQCARELPALCQKALKTQSSSYPSGLWGQAFHHHHANRQLRDQPNEPPQGLHGQTTRLPTGTTDHPPRHVTTTPKPGRSSPYPDRPHPGDMDMGKGHGSKRNGMSSGSGDGTGSDRTVPGGTGGGIGKDGEIGPTNNFPDISDNRPIVTPIPQGPGPMQWSEALVVGLVVGGISIFLLIAICVLIMCCCCRTCLPGCSPDRTPEEIPPVHPPDHPMRNPGYDTLEEGYSGRPPAVILYGSPNYAGLDRDEITQQEYTRLHNDSMRSYSDRYYEIAPGDVRGREVCGQAFSQGQSLPAGYNAAIPMAERRLPRIPDDYEQDAAIGHWVNDNRSHDVTGTLNGSDEDQWEYLEVFASPYQERPTSRQPSSVSVRSNDSGIDIK